MCGTQTAPRNLQSPTDWMRLTGQLLYRLMPWNQGVVGGAQLSFVSLTWCVLSQSQRGVVQDTMSCKSMHDIHVDLFSNRLGSPCSLLPWMAGWWHAMNSVLQLHLVLPCLISCLLARSHCYFSSCCTFFSPGIWSRIVVWATASLYTFFGCMRAQNSGLVCSRRNLERGLTLIRAMSKQWQLRFLCIYCWVHTATLSWILWTSPFVFVYFFAENYFLLQLLANCQSACLYIWLVYLRYLAILYHMVIIRVWLILWSTFHMNCL